MDGGEGRVEFSVMDQPLERHSVASCLLPRLDYCHMDTFNLRCNGSKEKKECVS